MYYLECFSADEQDNFYEKIKFNELRELEDHLEFEMENDKKLEFKGLYRAYEAVLLREERS